MAVCKVGSSPFQVVETAVPRSFSPYHPHYTLAVDLGLHLIRRFRQVAEHGWRDRGGPAMLGRGRPHKEGKERRCALSPLRISADPGTTEEDQLGLSDLPLPDLPAALQ